MSLPLRIKKGLLENQTYTLRKEQGDQYEK